MWYFLGTVQTMWYFFLNSTNNVVFFPIFFNQLQTSLSQTLLCLFIFSNCSVNNKNNWKKIPHCLYCSQKNTTLFVLFPKKYHIVCTVPKKYHIVCTVQKTTPSFVLFQKNTPIVPIFFNQLQTSLSQTLLCLFIFSNCSVNNKNNWILTS
jgi:hypothetical protein